LDEEFVKLIYEEEHGEEFEEPEFEEPEFEDEILQEERNTIDFEEDDKPIGQVDTEYSRELAETVITKKVKIGGYFGQEVEITTKVNNHNIPQSSNTMIHIQEEGETMSKEPVSITSLRPPKKKTIKLCKICGETVKNMSICPTCGAKID
jgi:hypothetical protein